MDHGGAFGGDGAFAHADEYRGLKLDAGVHFFTGRGFVVIEGFRTFAVHD